MATQPMDLAQLTERLERLEKRNEQLSRHNRWLRTGILAVVLGVGLAVTLQQTTAAPGTGLPNPTPGKPTVLTATGVNIVDNAGRVRMSLAVGGDGSAGVVLYRSGKDLAANFFVDSNGLPQLHMFDATKNKRQVLGVNSDGQPHLSQFDKTGSKRASYFLDKDSGANTVLYDSNKVVRAWLNVAAGFPETPALGLYDARGGAIWVAK
jgi:hypothetical protein